jgi:ribose 1,5-bisphosphokinase
MTEATHRRSEGVEPVGPGCLVLIVGPSGAGKDTLIAEVRRELDNRADIHFVTRVVTRPQDDTEHCIAASPAEFAAQSRAGAFALSWQAHGLAYGVPIEINAMLEKGETVVANVSRTIIADVRRRYSRSCVILIDASPEVRRKRLFRRGRENQNDTAARLSREINAGRDAQPDVRILNDGSIEAAVDELKQTLLRHSNRAGSIAVRRPVSAE